jgi:tRNA-binding protein
MPTPPNLAHGIQFAPQIQWEDFEKIDIRVGTIREVKDFPKAKKPAYQLVIDFGAFGTRNSSAQITHLYGPDDLVGRQIVAIVNFPPKQIANFFSECLVLGVYTDKNEVVLLTPGREVENGWKVG